MHRRILTGLVAGTLLLGACSTGDDAPIGAPASTSLATTTLAEITTTTTPVEAAAPDDAILVRSNRTSQPSTRRPATNSPGSRWTARSAAWRPSANRVTS